jgi:hypothetical protein
MELDSRAPTARTHTLFDGAPVRLRLARARDDDSLRALLSRCTPGRDGLDAARLARYDPRYRVVIYATALIDSTQAVVGVGTADLDGAQPP